MYHMEASRYIDPNRVFPKLSSAVSLVHPVCQFKKAVQILHQAWRVGNVRRYGHLHKQAFEGNAILWVIWRMDSDSQSCINDH